MHVTLLNASDAGNALELSDLISSNRYLIRNEKNRCGLIVKIDGVPSGTAGPVVQWMLDHGGSLLQTNPSGISEQNGSVVLFGDKDLFFTLVTEFTQRSGSAAEIIRLLAITLDFRYHNYPYTVKFRSATLNLAEKTHIMGILNITPDSFYDGGKFILKDKAVARVLQMVEEGADIIDIGGESSRPGAKPVHEKAEIARTIPVLEAIRERIAVPISIDTTKSTVAKAALEAGADMINDISGMSSDPEMAGVAAAYGVPVVLMHMQGTPETMQHDPHYDRLIAEIRQGLEDRIQNALRAGISKNNIIIDPGIGFGKRRPDNFKILRHLSDFRRLGYPILIGVSRKACIGWALDLPEGDRLLGTVSAVVASILRGAHIVRVHDVKEMAQAVRIADLIKQPYCPA